MIIIIVTIIIVAKVVKVVKEEHGVEMPDTEMPDMGMPDTEIDLVEAVPPSHLLGAQGRTQETEGQDFLLGRALLRLRLGGEQVLLRCRRLLGQRLHPQEDRRGLRHFAAATGHLLGFGQGPRAVRLRSAVAGVAGSGSRTART